MPWYPFFQKMDMADIFVILSHCQFEKNGFQHRFNFDDRWYSLSSFKGLVPIVDKKYVNANRDWEKIKKGLFRYADILDLFDDCISESMAETNSAIIRKVATLLNLKTIIVDDYKTDLIGTERLVDICISNNATTYISGISGKKYLDLKLFEEKNIKVIYQDIDEMTKKPVLEILKNNL